MKKFSECEECQKRLKYILFAFSLIGFAVVINEIYKQIKKLKK